MCIKMPASKSEFLDVAGVGYIKQERYGDRFIGAILEFMHDKSNGGASPDESPEPAPSMKYDESAVETSDDAVTVASSQTGSTAY
jgi:hypothetical protein